ncbi:MAG: hypothetical protein QXF07_01480 [Candidatus Micrarchaeia archaeon]
MDLDKMMKYILMLYIVFSLILLIGLVWSTNKATIPEVGFLVFINIVGSLIGLYRIRAVKDATQEGINRKGIIGAQHSWLVLSLNSAVLSLLFGSFFSDSKITMIFQYVFLTIICILSAYVIIEVALKKLPILE